MWIQWQVDDAGMRWHEWVQPVFRIQPLHVILILHVPLHSPTPHLLFYFSLQAFQSFSNLPYGGPIQSVVLHESVVCKQTLDELAEFPGLTTLKFSACIKYERETTETLMDSLTSILTALSALSDQLQCFEWDVAGAKLSPAVESIIAGMPALVEHMEIV